MATKNLKQTVSWNNPYLGVTIWKSPLKPAYIDLQSIQNRLFYDAIHFMWDISWNTTPKISYIRSLSNLFETGCFMKPFIYKGQSVKCPLESIIFAVYITPMVFDFTDCTPMMDVIAYLCRFGLVKHPPRNHILKQGIWKLSRQLKRLISSEMSHKPPRSNFYRRDVTELNIQIKRLTSRECCVKSFL